MTELTKDQEAKLQTYITKWTEKGFSIRDENEAGVTAETLTPIVAESYKAAGYKAPEAVTVVDSPLEVVAAGLILFSLELVAKEAK